MTNADLNLMQEVLAVAEAAGREIMAIYADASRWAVQTKADESPLTAADLAAHHRIVEDLAGIAAPWAALPVLSEESSEAELAGRRDWPACWLVDPLDGTKEFIARNGEFSVNIALIVDDAAVLGIVHGPATGVSYVAAKGLGSFRVDVSGWHRVHTTALPAKGERPIQLTVSRRHGLEQLALFEQVLMDDFGAVQSVPAGSAFKICAVAEGRADAYPRFGPTSEWDTAAAQIVLEEAGGHLIDCQGRVFRYNRRDTVLNSGFLAVGSEPQRWLNYWPTL
ncbi:MAG: 3'(2'),5'-bisphosphate nucleotidase CysQ [Pseudomonadota bacterium]